MMGESKEQSKFIVFFEFLFQGRNKPHTNYQIRYRNFIHG